MLTLGLPVKASDTVTVSHFYSGGNRELKDVVGRPAPAFRDFAVDNELALHLLFSSIVIEGPVPVRADVAGRSLRIVFSEALNESGTAVNQGAF